MAEQGFLLQEQAASESEATEERFADLDALAARLKQITAQQVLEGLRVRWRRENQPDVWLEVEPGGYPLAMVWRCAFCNTQIHSNSSRPEFARDCLDRYAPHDHDGQLVTIDVAKQLVREAYAAVAEAPGQSWVTLTAIFNKLGDGYRKNLGGRNNPRRTAEIAIVLMGEHDVDVALNAVPYRQEADLHQLVHCGGWADALLIGPHLPKPTPVEDESW